MKGTELLKIIHSSVIVVYISKPCTQSLKPNKNRRWVNRKEEFNHFFSYADFVENSKPILIYPKGLCRTEARLKINFSDS